MRQLARSFALVSLLVFCPGCFIFDELDSGMELMKESSSTGGKKSQEEAAAAPAPKKEGKKIDLAGWWKGARTPTSGPKEPDTAVEIVSCRIGGSVRFMSKTDCQVQGGRF